MKRTKIVAAGMVRLWIHKSQLRLWILLLSIHPDFPHAIWLPLCVSCNGPKQLLILLHLATLVFFMKQV